MTRKIPVFSPIVGNKEYDYVVDCLKTHWISQGKYVTAFQDEFASFCERKHGIATSNGTTALHLAGIILDVGPEDEVLVSASTNMASAFSMYYQGAKPVPVDIEEDTWLIDPNDIEHRITDRTKAIVVVHLFGQPADMDPINRIAKKYHLKVIEDCAQATGAKYNGKKVGSLGDVGCFSFYSNKIITCGEGGMVLTDDDDLAQKARAYGNFCYGKENRFNHDGIGYNYRMSNLNAALGLGQLQRIDEILQKKKSIYDRYVKNLKGLPGFRIPKIRANSESVLWMFNAHLTEDFGLTRNQLLAALKEKGIETREAFVPLNLQKTFLQMGLVQEGSCPVANYIMNAGFYLPSGLTLTEDDIDYVCDSILKLAKTTAHN